MSYFVYILQSEKDDSYYIGHTNDLKGRVERHNQGRSAYTRNRGPWKLICHECFESRAEAMRRERELKAKKDRHYVDLLVRTATGQ